MVLILDLVVNDLAVEKLSDRGITRIEVEQVVSRGPAVLDNAEARVKGSRAAIGPTDAARFLTVILQPDEDSATRWHVMTAWESSTRQIAAFHRQR